MIIVETKIFTKLITELLQDSDYKKFQENLVNSPKSGRVIKDSGGIRKIRWSTENKGKRSGLRIIYYYADSKDKILMLYVYRKNDLNDLTKNQIKVIRDIIEKEYKNE
jgi:mRNA-degrading endonuclease RelE of RelBE toxin-antitoxin system